MTDLRLHSGAFDVHVADVDPKSVSLDAAVILHARSGPITSDGPAWPAEAWDAIRRVECRASGQTVGTCFVRYHCLVADLDEQDVLLIGDRLLLLVDDSVIAFELPSLRIAWRSLEAEEIPWCFKLIRVPESDRVLVHREWEIGCLDLDGKRVWHTANFADVLSGPSHLDADAYIVEDFNGWRYRVALDSGATTLVHRPESSPGDPASA